MTAFTTARIFVVIAKLGDKTQLAKVALAVEYRVY